MILLDKAKEANDYYKYIEDIFMDILRPIDIPLNLNQLIILDNLKKIELTRQSDAISKTSMNHNLNKLINMGLITKITNYCSDKRRVKFELTDDGNQLLRKLISYEKKLLNEIGDNNVK